MQGLIAALGILGLVAFLGGAPQEKAKKKKKTFGDFKPDEGSDKEEESGDSPDKKTSGNACEAAADGLVPLYSLRNNLPQDVRTSAVDLETGATKFSSSKLGQATVLQFQKSWNLVSGAVRSGRVSNVSVALYGNLPSGALGTDGIVGQYTRRAYAFARLVSAQQGRPWSAIVAEVKAVCPK